MNWPVVPGRYYVGNKSSCVAVCTLASIDLLEKFKNSSHFDKIAIFGKCLSLDTEVLLEDESEISLLELENKWKDKKIVSFDFKTGKTVTTHIVEYHKNFAPILKLTTETNRVIKATKDHLFYTPNGWVPLENLKTNDKVLVYPFVKRQTDMNTALEQKILDYKDIQKRCGKLFSSRSIKIVIKRLTKLGLLPLSSMNKKLLILARVLGHIFGDGHLSKPCFSKKSKRIYLSTVFSGKEEDLIEMRKDLLKLGFRPNKIKESKSGSTVIHFVDGKWVERKIKGSAKTFRCNASSLWILLYSLGAPYGDKTLKKYLIPRWLLNAPLSIQREFLAAFAGSEIEKIYIKEWNPAIEFSLNKREDLKTNAIKFANQLNNMFTNFGINFRLKKPIKSALRKDGIKTIKIHSATQHLDSLLNFCKKIGYVYNNSREIFLRYVYEYLLVRKNVVENRKQLIAKLKEKYKKHEISVKDIMNILNRSNSDVYYLLSHATLRTVHKLNFPKFKDWIKEATKNLGNSNFIWENIKSIEPDGTEDVRDITTNEIHNFIANGFVVHNCVTENIGIEKIVQNIVTNPNIRFLILCGKESYGHYVGQAILSLVKNGIDENFNIIGAVGPMAMLKNLTREQIENFRAQVKVIDLIGCEDMEKILNHVEECERKNPGPFEGKVEIEIKPIIAWHDESKDVILDPKGFFTIFVDQRANQIVVEHYIVEWDEEALKNYSGDWKKCMKSQKLNKIIVGKNAEEICHTIIREGLLSRLEHAAYLGRELKKAEISLMNKLPYEQE